MWVKNFCRKIFYCRTTPFPFMETAAPAPAAAAPEAAAAAPAAAKPSEGGYEGAAAPAPAGDVQNLHAVTSALVTPEAISACHLCRFAFRFDQLFCPICSS